MNPTSKPVPIRPHRTTWVIEPGTLSHLALILLIGMPIAALLPFDPAFLAATGGSPWLRMLLLGGLAIAGYAMGNLAGLSLKARRVWRAWLIAMAAAFSVALAIGLIDGVIWRDQLSPAYISVFQTELVPRMLAFMLRAFNENVIYRLFLFSGFCLLLGSVWRGRDGRLPFGAVLLAAILSQAINIAINVVWISPGGTGTNFIAYDAARYIMPGVVWALLYWRYGFVAAEIASVTCHAFLQPIMGVLLKV